LGRTVAFTSDASARWGVNWVTWQDYARFWSQAARWTITEGTDSNLEVRVEQRGEQAYLVVDARDNEGEFLNGLNLNAAVVSPDLQSANLNVSQVAPGRYEVAFTPETQGAYFVRVAGVGGGEEDISVAQTGGWVLSYSAEYTLAETDVRFLDTLSRITGGQSLEGNPKAVFDHNLSIQNVSEPIWQYLLAAAALLLVLDVAVRRIVITPSDLEAARETIAKTFRFGSSEERRLATSGRMTELMDAKRRTTSIYTATENEEAAKPMPSPRPGKAAASSSQSKREPAAGSGKPQRQTGSEGGTLASRLLEKRKHEDN
jgi:hypothetical protein